MVWSWLLSSFLSFPNKFGPPSKQTKIRRLDLVRSQFSYLQSCLDLAVPKNFAHDLVPKSQISKGVPCEFHDDWKTGGCLCCTRWCIILRMRLGLASIVYFSIHF